jgi:hypothetical protein
MYYTIVILGYGRSPLLPWRKLKHAKFNILLGALSIQAAVSFAFLPGNCKTNGGLVVLRFLKLAAGVCNGIVGIQAGRTIVKVQAGEMEDKPPYYTTCVPALCFCERLSPHSITLSLTITI